MSVQTEIDRIITAVHAAHEKVKEKGGTTSEPYLVANLEDAIGSIPEASDPTLQSKTVSPATSQQVVTPDSGYDGLSSVTVNAMPTATQATPSISVSSAGKITATATQTAGYVSAGTKSATKQLTVQAAKTITPTKSSQTAVASGRYTTGAVTVAAIPSQYITTTDATAAATDILSGKTAYVNGSKVTGSVATFDGSYECSGDSTGGSGSGSSAPTIADFTHTEEVGDEPGMYNYTLSSSSLQSSTRYVITIFTRDTGAQSQVWKTFYRYSLSDSFIACKGSNGYVSNGLSLTLDEDTVTIAGASIMNSAFSNFWFIAT